MRKSLNRWRFKTVQKSSQQFFFFYSSFRSFFLLSNPLVKPDDSSDSVEDATSNKENAIAKRIIGANTVNEKTMFLVQFHGLQGASLVPSEVANAKWPQIVIKFYEERLVWMEPKD